jgi:antitoxin component of RelBE/YafQ-DinJ toxin-antitoxin module
VGKPKEPAKPSRAERVKINLTVDKATWQAAKEKRKAQGMSISFAINKFLAQWVKES